MAFVGIGHQAAHDFSMFAYYRDLVNVVALCDTQMGASHTLNVLKEYSDAPRYQDFRKMLGVGKEDLERDWESTFYNGMSIPGVDDPKHARGTQHFDAGFAKYGKPGDPLARRIELYLLDCGVTEAEIAAFRSIMLSSD